LVGGKQIAYTQKARQRVRLTGCVVLGFICAAL